MTDKNKDKDDSRGLLIGGVITLGFGIIFLLSNLNILPSLREMWPLILIIVGVALIVAAFKKDKPEDVKETEQKTQ